MPAIYETFDEQPPSTHVPQDVPLAEIFTIPGHRIVSIEHPCIIRNLDNGLKSMGGEARMKHILEHRVGDSLLNPQKPKPEPELGVSLRPQDPLAAKMTSTGIDTRNVLVKITVPRRTGRKRKRGGDAPYQHDCDLPGETSITAPQLLKRLRDNADSYVIEPVAMVHETHRFRSLPDFQTKAGDVPIFQELRDNVINPSWSTLNRFGLDSTPGLPMMTSFPGPPSFAATSQPYRYEYQQAQGVRFSKDEEGNVKSTNTQAPQRRLVKAVAPDVAEIPQGPPPELRAHNPFGTFLPKVVNILRKVLEERPLVTKRVAMNSLPQCSDTIFREATQWVGYSFSAGPFRDTLIKYGVDPRKDPKYRFYQTLMFQLDKRAQRASGETSGKWNRTAEFQVDTDQPRNNSHLFDGQHVSTNGKTWQICDLTDPLIKGIFDTTTLPGECDVHVWGWYYDGTICKGRVIMREMMDKLFDGEPVPREAYALACTLPEHPIMEFSVERALVYFGNVPHAREASMLAADIRGIARSGSKAYFAERVAGLRKDGPKKTRMVHVGAEADIQGDLDEIVDDAETVDGGVPAG